MITAIAITAVLCLAVGSFGGYKYGAKVSVAAKQELSNLENDVRSFPDYARTAIADRLKGIAGKI